MNLSEIGERLRSQDNERTANPMFCVQRLVRDTCYHPDFFVEHCWYNSKTLEMVYEKPPGSEWTALGYKDRWETVMVAFTRKGCEEYLELNGHNDRRVAHDGQVRIFVDSFHRCPEMIAIRDYLMSRDPAKAEVELKR